MSMRETVLFFLSFELKFGKTSTEKSNSGKGPFWRAHLWCPIGPPYAHPGCSGGGLTPPSFLTRVSVSPKPGLPVPCPWQGCDSQGSHSPDAPGFSRTEECTVVPRSLGAGGAFCWQRDSWQPLMG